MANGSRTSTVKRRKDLALDALGRALRLRGEMGIKPQAPASVFDVIDKLGIKLRFMPIPSLEGVYRGRPNPVILVSSERPPGRQAYTGAHELGHHVYGHGVAVGVPSDDAGQEPPESVGPEEYLADRFAGFFLMPKTAVKYGFRARGWEPKECTPRQVYTVAGWLGVGYAALVHHMRGSLRMLAYPHSARLLKATPKDIRAGILGREVRENLLVVGEKWTDRAVDVQVGDLILLPSGTRYEGKNLRVVEETERAVLLTATAPGIGRVHRPESGWAAFVRVSRRNYVGLGPYRHWEDPDYEAEDD
ncbi:ImmA/IrrE family metallo-endopeptidase [Rubrobacter marinus]|uniref:ImmA/IrrE family metallo-endopeptidase n=1 Tax=Rubrobacter marinus TaxID=2653852 RepID=A0A6G8PVR4_9ACTN|nr:ImmA/IrrE family metallo-endopeptidase [Rubrobacter marinus]QIN78299.1 ImmA/IrrE family metallo-endopeptidase [Rubrobacter marinus]